MQLTEDRSQQFCSNWQWYADKCPQQYPHYCAIQRWEAHPSILSAYLIQGIKTLGSDRMAPSSLSFLLQSYGALKRMGLAALPHEKIIQEQVQNSKSMIGEPLVSTN